MTGVQVPIIAAVKQKKLEVNEQASLPTFYSSEFLAGLMTNPELVRNVAVIGHLHHGKSLVRFSSWTFPWAELRRQFSDIRVMERYMCCGSGRQH